MAKNTDMVLVPRNDLLLMQSALQRATMLLQEKSADGGNPSAPRKGDKVGKAISRRLKKYSK
jgi:hypothetical protein